MIDYKALYFQLFNGISDVIEMMEADKEHYPEDGIAVLKELQIQAEEAYLSQEE